MRHDRDALVDHDTPEAVLLREVTSMHFDRLGVDSVALHDPLAVAVALESDLITTLETEVVVETQGRHSVGQTVADLRGRRQSNLLSPLHRVCLDVDVSRARRLFFSALGLDLPDAA